MATTIHVYMHNAADKAEILHAIHLLRKSIMNELKALQDAVAAEDTVIDSAVTLLAGLKTSLDAAIASGDPAALTALSADIGAKTKSLADAITANTPAAPAPTPVP